MKPDKSSLKNILITGGAGFIGSNFIAYFLDKYPDYSIVNLDKLTYAGSLENLADIDNNDRYYFIKGDICDQDLVDSIFREHNIDGVIHFAAESHVDRSIDEPSQFIKTNIEGTYVLLEVARKHWSANSEDLSSYRFHHISTDEVYGSLGATGHFDEASAYAPNSPYSASKAASDFLVRSYHKTYGLNVVTSNCSNNYGPRQHDEKLIPTVIRNAVRGQEIPIYGDGSNVRDWLYVEDHCLAIDMVFHNGRAGETYLIGGDGECNNLDITGQICEILNRKYPKDSGSYSDQISFVKDRPGHDFRYAINAAKVRSELNWKPEESLLTGLEKTVNWYLKKYGKS